MTDFSSVIGKVVIVTGAGSGMGKAMAKTFAENKMKVVLADIDDVKGQAACDEIVENGGEAIFKHTNVGIEEDVKNLVQTAVDTYGKLDGIVNNAGIGLVNTPIHEMTMEDYDKVLSVDLKGVFLGMKYGAEAILKSKVCGGFIISTASIAAFQATEGMALYSLCKHAVVGMTKAAALDYALHNITVNAICPGSVKTEIWDQAPQAYIDHYCEKVPTKRLAEPVEIANVALFLASDLARYMTGTTITIDGATTAGHSENTVWKNPDIDK